MIMIKSDIQEYLLRIGNINEVIKNLSIGYFRYEKLRKLNPRQFKDLYDKCTLSGQRFDDAVDKLEG